VLPTGAAVLPAPFAPDPTHWPAPQSLILRSAAALRAEPQTAPCRASSARDHVAASVPPALAAAPIPVARASVRRLADRTQTAAPAVSLRAVAAHVRALRSQPNATRNRQFRLPDRWQLRQAALAALRSAASTRFRAPETPVRARVATGESCAAPIQAALCEHLPLPRDDLPRAAAR